MDFDFNTETITPDNTNILTIGGTGGLEISVGTTAERPAAPINGTVRYNTDIALFEFYQNNSWVSLASSILTTKGDLLTHNSSVEVRLPVGADGGVIVADSATITGLAWIPNPVITQDTLVGGPTGFVNRTDSEMLFNNATREFTIQPVTTSFTIYQRGIEYVKSSAETVTITNVSGFHFVYYDINGVLQSSVTPYNLETQAPVSLIYWNAVIGAATLNGEERHGLVMDWTTHQYLHTTQGSRYVSGFAASNYTLVGIGNSNSDAQIGVQSGIIADEDIRIAITNSASPSAIFEQIISPIGQFPILYRLGATGVYYRDAATAFPLSMGTTYPKWNEFNGSAWVTTEATSGSYIAMWIIATNDINFPIVSIMGQNDSLTLGDAQNDNGFGDLSTGIPFQEFRPLFRLIFEVQSSYTNSVKSALRDILDVRLDSTQIIVTNTPQPGSVSYVGLSLPSVFSVSGSPITSVGTLSATLSLQSANTVFSGPTTGSPAAPTFRTLSIDEMNDVVLTAPTTNNILKYNGANWINSAGYVSSVAATGSTGLVIGGSPITSSGTLTFTLDTGLQNLATFATTGLVVSTGTDTWVGRSILGTTNRITVTNGDGLAGPPTADIAPTYIGQSSITTLGTITTGTWNGITVGATFGGTGQSGYAVGDILYANTTTTLAKLADVATGNALISGGVGVAPSWGKISLTTAISGILPIANGGTNLSTTPTNGQLLIGNGIGYTLASITAGTGISVTPGAGSISIANTGVISFTVTQPAAGITATNTGVSQTGAASTTLALANDLAAVEGLATTGLATRTGTDTWNTRTITGTANTIDVTVGDGVAGNPTITIANNPILPGTSGMVLNSGTLAQRPVSPTEGTIRFNTTSSTTEVFQNGAWYTLAGTTNGRGIINIYSGQIPAATGTSVVPWDNTPPTSAEGTEIWAVTVTPSIATSSFTLTVPFTVDCATSNRVVITSLFRNAVNIGSALFFATGGGRPATTTLSVTDLPATISPVTYSMRSGIGSGAGNWYVNSTSSGNNLGGALVSSYQITEVG